MWIIWGLLALSLFGMIGLLEYVKVGAKPKGTIAIIFYQAFLMAFLMTMLTFGKFDHFFRLGHLFNNFTNAIITMSFLTKLTRSVPWITKHDWMNEISDFLRKPIEGLVSVIFHILVENDVDVLEKNDEGDVDASESEEEDKIEATIGEVVTKMS